MAYMHLFYLTLENVLFFFSQQHCFNKNKQIYQGVAKDE